MPKSKGGLGGRGLSALYAATSEEYGMSDELPIDKIKPNPNQPRKNVDEDKLRELAESIKKSGLIEPIVVRTVKGGYEIIAGERRWRACKLNGDSTIKAIVRDASDQEAMELALIENLHRDDLNPIEEARGYKQLITEYKLKQSEVAVQVSKSRSAIANAMRLLDLPEEIQEYLAENKLSAGHARAILGLSNDEARLALAKKVIENQLTVRETENLVRLTVSGQDEKPTRQPLPKNFKVMAKSLRQRLDTDVRVTSSKGKNKIVIAFKDEDDLDRIYSILTGDAW